jgi:hypothetical protein
LATSYTPAARQQHHIQHYQPITQPAQQQTSIQVPPLGTLDAKVNTMFEEARSLHSNLLLENARRLLYIHALFLDTPLGGSKLYSIWTPNDQFLWQGYDRIVLSDHGIYLESYTQPANVTVGKVTSSGHFQSLWTDSNQRIYFQLKPVNDRQNLPRSGSFVTRNNRPDGHPYADYKPGAYYVSLFDVKIRDNEGQVIFDGPAIIRYAATLWSFLNGNAQVRSGWGRLRKASRSAPIAQRSRLPPTPNTLPQPRPQNRPVEHDTPTVTTHHPVSSSASTHHLVSPWPQNWPVDHGTPTNTMHRTSTNAPHRPAPPAQLRISVPDSEDQPRTVLHTQSKRSNLASGNEQQPKRKKRRVSRWGVQRPRQLLGFSP